MEKNTSETLYSLKFAERVRSVELGPGSRRAELASWSSQEHLEVQGRLMPVSGGTGPELPGGAGGRVWEQTMPVVLELELEPKPSSLFSPRISWPQSDLWGHQLVGGVDGLQAGIEMLSSDWFTSLHGFSHLTLTIT